MPLRRSSSFAPGVGRRRRAPGRRVAGLPPAPHLPSSWFPPSPTGASAGGGSVLEGDAGWSLAAALAARTGRGRVRVADLDATGAALNAYRREISVDGPPPHRPYAVYLADADGGYWLLGCDLDSGRGPVGEDLVELRSLLDRAGLPHLVCASGPGGGRHVWIGLAEAVPAPEVARLADALAARLPSLGTAPLRNPATGCLRPPGAPHRITGAASILTGDPAVLIAPRVGRIQLRRLLDLLGAAPAGDARPRTARGGAGGRAHLPGAPGRLPGEAQAALSEPLPADASAVLWRVLLGAVRARWRLEQLRKLLPTAPGLEHVRTERRGDRRVARPPGAQRALLRRQWQRALTHVQTAGPGADPTFSARCAPVVAAVAAGQARAFAARGRWARPGGPSDARVLAALALLTLQAVRPEVEADIRRPGELAGVCRETARRALGRLAAEGWIAQTAAAAGIHAARWRLNAPSAADCTPPAGTGVSQAVPRPHPTDPDPDPDPDPVRQRRAWLHALHRQLNQLAHDVWTPAGLGHHAARLHAALTDTGQSPQQLAEHTGDSASTVDHQLHRLHQAGLTHPDPRGWRRDPRTDAHRGDLADRLGVAGILTRRRRHAAEREAWAWWC